MNDDPPQSPLPAPESFAQWLHGWRYFVWFLVVLLVVTLFYVEENWRGSWAWSRYQRELKALGEPTNANDFVPPRLPDDQNFAATPLLSLAFGARSLQGFPPLSAAVAVAGEFQSSCRGARSGIDRRTNTWAAPPAGPAAWRATLLKASNQTVLTRERLLATNFTVTEAASAVLSALVECEPVFTELQSASKRPNSRFNIAYEQRDRASILLPHLAVLKQLSQLAWLRSSATLALGRENAAFEDVELMLRLAQAARTEPILVSQQVRADQFQMALQPIAQSIPLWSDAHLRALMVHLEGFDFCADFARVLRAERSFFGHGLIEYVRRHADRPAVLNLYGGFGASKPPVGLPWAGVLMAGMPEGWFDLEHLNYSRIYQDYLLPTIDSTNRLVSPSASARAEARLQELMTHSATGLFLRHKLFSALLMSRLPEVPQKAAIAQAGADLARLACALELYRRRHGHFPENLAQLVPEVVPSLPHDVISGQPLRYHRADDGIYVLYSVGWNQTDEGGKIVLGESGEIDRCAGDWVWQPVAK